MMSIKNYINNKSLVKANVTLFENVSGGVVKNLSKSYYLDANGALQKSSGGAMTGGKSYHVSVSSASELRDLLIELAKPENAKYALCWGIHNDPRPMVELVSSDPTPGQITRRRGCFKWSLEPSWFMIDYDPEEGSTALTKAELLDKIYKLAPEIKEAPHVWCPSSSSFIRKDGDTEYLPGHALAGQRVYVLMKTGADIVPYGDLLRKKSWAHGDGYIKISSSGSKLERQLMDASVWQPERLDHATTVKLGPGLRRGDVTANIEAFNDDAAPLDASLVKLSQVDENKYNKLTEEAKNHPITKSRSHAIGTSWAFAKAEKKAKEKGGDEEKLRELYLHAILNNVLDKDFVVEFQDGNDITVGEILENPEKYDGKYCYAPFTSREEGPLVDDRRAVLHATYGQSKRPVIYAFIRQNYFLRDLQSRISLDNPFHVWQDDILKSLRLQELAFMVGDKIFAREKRKDREFEYSEDKQEIVRENKDHVLVALEDPSTFVNRHLTFYKTVVDKKTNQEYEVDAEPPYSRVDSKLPLRSPVVLDHVEILTNHPIMDVQGKMHAQEGLNLGVSVKLTTDKTRNAYIDTKELELPGPIEPKSLDYLEKNLTALMGYFSEMPWDAAGRSVYLMYLLGVIGGTALPTRPGLFINATVRGSGKSTLSRILMYLSDQYQMVSQSRNSEEFEKTLVSALLAKKEYLVFDNLEGRVGMPLLHAALTNESISLRRLGQSDNIELDNTSQIIMNGNQIQPDEDMRRRLYYIDLAPVESAEAIANKEYKIKDLASHFYEPKLRGKVLHLLACTLSTYVKDRGVKLPDGVFPKNDFTEFDMLLRGCVLWLKEKIPSLKLVDPARSADPYTGTDERTENDRELLRVLYSCFPNSFLIRRQLKKIYTESTKMVFNEETRQRDEALNLILDSNTHEDVKDLCINITELCTKGWSSRYLNGAFKNLLGKNIGGFVLRTKNPNQTITSSLEVVWVGEDGKGANPPPRAFTETNNQVFEAIEKRGPSLSAVEPDPFDLFIEETTKGLLD